MGTKNNPGRWDCYASADPDEPIFTMKSTDPLAPLFVELWAAMRAHDGRAVDEAFGAALRRSRIMEPATGEKIAEARKCAREMRAWRGTEIDEVIDTLRRRRQPHPAEPARREGRSRDDTWADNGRDHPGPPAQRCNACGATSKAGCQLVVLTAGGKAACLRYRD